jgi:hypothetical protein
VFAELTKLGLDHVLIAVTPMAKPFLGEIGNPSVSVKKTVDTMVSKNSVKKCIGSLNGPSPITSLHRFGHIWTKRRETGRCTTVRVSHSHISPSPSHAGGERDHEPRKRAGAVIWWARAWRNLMRNSVDGRQEQERYIHRSCGNFGGSNRMGNGPRFDNFLGSQSH